MMTIIEKAKELQTGLLLQRLDDDTKIFKILSLQGSNNAWFHTRRKLRQLKGRVMGRVQGKWDHGNGNFFFWSREGRRGCNLLGMVSISPPPTSLVYIFHHHDADQKLIEVKDTD
eukprot:TRINITY_DN19732_c0_g1_i1.p1 TRINITY_DN19732_c0_g1~~TRINITY_DN19732_c0_g1_i1.p1  ORF type:complete len:115 (-),score=15.33 TRINITY_DN19732_c0_g1_i1:168-512(-)